MPMETREVLYIIMQLMQDNYNFNFLITIFVVLNCCFMDYKISNTELKIKAARLPKLFNAAYADDQAFAKLAF